MAIAGKDGSLYLGANKVAEVSDFSLDFGADMLETTNMDSSGWKEFIAGLREWSGSAEANWKMTDTNGQLAIQNAWLNGTTLSANFKVSSTQTYSGSVLVESMGVQVPIGDKVSVSFSFRGTGALSYA